MELDSVDKDWLQEELDEEDADTAKEWFMKFKGKYKVVGKVRRDMQED